MWKSCRPGGDKGGIAKGWESNSVISKTFLPFVWVSLLLPIFLEEITPDDSTLEELLLSTDFKKLSFETLVFIADAIVVLKTPDSLRLWIITWREKN